MSDLILHLDVLPFPFVVLLVHEANHAIGGIRLTFYPHLYPCFMFLILENDKVLSYLFHLFPVVFLVLCVFLRVVRILKLVHFLFLLVRFFLHVVQRFYVLFVLLASV